MATKPDIALARFANTGGADILTPSSGLRDTGFVAATPIVQSYVNELFAQHYAWAKYVDEGELDGDVVIDGTLEVTGDITGGGDLDITDDITGGGDLDVGGSATVGGDVNATGDLNHAEEWTIGLDASCFCDMDNVALTPVTETHDGKTYTVRTLGTNGKIQCSIPLRAGDRITEIAFFMTANATGAVAFTISLIGQAFAGQTVHATYSDVTPLATHVEQYGFNPNHTISVLESCVLRIACNDVSGSSGFAFAIVKYTHPA